uniref:Large ribosomal subunit protein bL20c n=1 Tax=Pseudochlorodesmis sp. HV01306c TaxID=2358490 RepID=A0A386AYH7_9CHLO|nr:ribosomal protein L20 [Pseudochlorodesmis sp. HV01306c]
MTRVKRGNISKKRHQKKLKIAKGFRGQSSILYKTANQQILKALQNSFIDRRLKKRDFRNLWINRMNARIRQFGLNYNLFIVKNKKINRKVLAQLALYDSSIFLNFKTS